MPHRCSSSRVTAAGPQADDFTLLCRNAIAFNTNAKNPFRLAAQLLHKQGTAVLEAHSTA